MSGQGQPTVLQAVMFLAFFFIGESKQRNVWN